MAHKPGHPNEKMISFMDSLNIKNSAIKRMAATKKIDSLMSTGPGGMPYYKSTGTMMNQNMPSVSDSAVGKVKKVATPPMTKYEKAKSTSKYRIIGMTINNKK